MSRQSRPELEQFPEPDRPLREMTLAERTQYAQQIRRALRDDQIRVGNKRPRNARELHIATEGQAERDERTAKRIARAERKQATRPAEPGSRPGAA